jgi:hypothetical protein
MPNDRTSWKIIKMQKARPIDRVGEKSWYVPIDHQEAESQTVTNGDTGAP